MVIKKNALIGKLSERNNLNVNIKTDLRDFTRKLWKEYEEGPKNLARRSAICMLGYLYNDNTGAHNPRKINVIGDIYSFTKQEIKYGFRCYGKKTWRALNDILRENGLSAVDLPEKYSY